MKAAQRAIAIVIAMNGSNIPETLNTISGTKPIEDTNVPGETANV